MYKLTYHNITNKDDCQFDIPLSDWLYFNAQRKNILIIRQSSLKYYHNPNRIT